MLNFGASKPRVRGGPGPPGPPPLDPHLIIHTMPSDILSGYSPCLTGTVFDVLHRNTKLLSYFTCN